MYTKNKSVLLYTQGVKKPRHCLGFFAKLPERDSLRTMRACFEESGLTKNSNLFDADRSADHTAPTSNTNRLILLENCNLHVW